MHDRRSSLLSDHRWVISPLLANLLLHYAFDAWMRRTFPAVQFERYAEIEVVAYPLDPQQRPLLDAPEQGRFIALRAGQVNPREFNAGRFLTLRGPITGERTLTLRGQAEKVAEMDARELVLWPWDYRFQRSRVSVSIGVSGRL